MLDQQQRHSVSVHNVAQGGNQAPGFPWIQPGGRLVEEYYFRARGQSLGHLDEAAGAERQSDHWMIRDFLQLQ